MILVNSRILVVPTILDLDGVLELNFATDQRLTAWRNSVGGSSGGYRHRTEMVRLHPSQN